ncbi:MAG: radical SAM family heme chaperone HemW [Proteobacteria bacterium]|nr:radical SAM family heme chaperone HemW [Pseudomonadota bacterium]
MQGNEGFGLYVHWPFCISKCPYCDFNSHVAQSIDQGAWKQGLLTELAHFAGRTPDKILTSVFFGGGTPSLMDPATTAAIIEAARKSWRTANDLEITLEANPGTVDADRFNAIRDAGVNRLSMGVQALNDADLKFLGRRHGVAEARRAWRTAAKIFPRVSFDLIYARPTQTPEAWRRELGEALREVKHNGITHLSLYQLTMEPGTAMFDAHERGEFALPNEDDAATMFEDTQVLCAESGFPAYEISNHAADGSTCRHNLTYWRGGDYVGVGPGAHGRLTLNGGAVATRQIKAPALWLKKVETAGQGTQEESTIAAEDRARELLMMGLRIAEGVDKARFTRLAGRTVEDLANPGSITRLVEGGFLEDGPEILKATAPGRMALNAVLRELLV